MAQRIHLRALCARLTADNVLAIKCVLAIRHAGGRTILIDERHTEGPPYGDWRHDTFRTSDRLGFGSVRRLKCLRPKWQWRRRHGADADSDVAPAGRPSLHHGFKIISQMTARDQGPGIIRSQTIV